ncbi:MAG: T9SS type A sorting domain-containing protein [Melioribacteraceae bacterium]|jgi:hypothetical protein|nr:T9SS type A sorting domain-containing protein [Melioribacteraceae bacterium]
MKKVYLLLIIALFSSNIFAQYAEVSIKDIQFQTNDALLTAGASNSEPVPALVTSGDTVIVSGVVMCPPYEGANPDSIRTLHAGAPAIYLQDPNDRSWSGVMVRDGSFAEAFSILDTGLIIKFKTTVSEYFTSTQLVPIDFQASDIIGQQLRPQPVVLTLDSLVEKGSGNPNYLAEKWEGVYVEFQNVTATEPGAIGGGSFKIFDENNSVIVVGVNADFYRRIPEPLPGTKIERIRGFIETRTNIEGGWFMINPIFEDDVVYGDVFPPNVSNVERDLATVQFGESVNISSVVTDIDGSVVSAQVVYYVDTERQTPVDLVTSDSVWTGTIPALNNSAIVSYFVQAYDNEGNLSFSPNDTTNGKYFYHVLNRDLTIQDVQFTYSASGFSGYNNYSVTLEGVVTSDTSDISGQIYIQNGSGEWSAIQLFGTATEALQRNDKISVTGIVNEIFGVTRLGDLDEGVNLTILESGVPAPEVTEIATAVIGTGGLPTEAMEGVLINYTNITVVDENADGDIGGTNFGEMLVADGTGVGTRVELQDGLHDYHNFWDAALENEPIRILDASTFDELVGILWYSFGNYKLVPRNNDDFVGYTDIDENIEIPQVFSLSQNYPNPFNPTTVIQYSLSEVTNVKLKVYDMLGREIATLVNREQTAGVYNVEFNATNLSSGVYFYRVEAGSFVASKKLLLLK